MPPTAATSGSSERFDPAVGADAARAPARSPPRATPSSKPVTLCGELASKPLGALALVALGYRSLSVTPSAIGPVKAMLLELDAGKAAKLLAR